MTEVHCIVSLDEPKEILNVDGMVFVRENIKSIVVFDNILLTQNSAYMYDEKRYTYEEYADMELNKRLTKVEDDIKVVMLAVAEFINGDKTECPIEHATRSILTGYSAIAQMYANMIQKGIYTISKVPARYKDEVLEILSINK